jgi:hypothetical protein
LNGNKKFFAIAALLALFAGFAAAATSANATVHFVVPSSFDFTIAYDSNCTGGTFYFVESDGTIDGTQTAIYPTDDASHTNVCQSTLADGNLMTVTVTGTQATDFNGFWTAAVVTGTTTKVWLAKAAGGCDTAGCEASCSVSDAEDPVTATTCRNVTQTATPGAKWRDNLASGNKQGFCMCDDFSGVAVGDVSKTLTVKSGG